MGCLTLWCDKWNPKENLHFSFFTPRDYLLLWLVKIVPHFEALAFKEMMLSLAIGLFHLKNEIEILRQVKQYSIVCNPTL